MSPAIFTCWDHDMTRGEDVRPSTYSSGDRRTVVMASICRYPADPSGECSIRIIRRLGSPPQFNRYLGRREGTGADGSLFRRPDQSNISLSGSSQELQDFLGID